MYEALCSEELDLKWWLSLKIWKVDLVNSSKYSMGLSFFWVLEGLKLKFYVASLLCLWGFVLALTRIWPPCLGWQFLRRKSITPPISMLTSHIILCVLQSRPAINGRVMVLQWVTRFSSVESGILGIGAKLFNDLPIKQYHDLKYFKIARKCHIFSD